MNSPPSLVKYSRDQAGLLFLNMNAERLKDIGRSPYEGENLSEWVQTLSSEFPRQATWGRATGPYRYPNRHDRVSHGQQSPDVSLAV